MEPKSLSSIGLMLCLPGLRGCMSTTETVYRRSSWPFPAWIGQRLMKFHPQLRNCWQLMASGGRRIRRVWHVVRRPCSSGWSYTHKYAGESSREGEKRTRKIEKSDRLIQKKISLHHWGVRSFLPAEQPSQFWRLVCKLLREKLHQWSFSVLTLWGKRYLRFNNILLSFPPVIQFGLRCKRTLLSAWGPESGCWWSQGPTVSGEKKGVNQVLWPASKFGSVNFTS